MSDVKHGSARQDWSSALVLVRRRPVVQAEYWRIWICDWCNGQVAAVYRPYRCEFCHEERCMQEADQ